MKHEDASKNKFLNISPEMDLHTSQKNCTITFSCCSTNQCILKRFNFQKLDIVEFLKKSNYKTEDFLLKTPELISLEAKEKNINLNQEEIDNIEKEHRLKLCKAYKELIYHAEENKNEKSENPSKITNINPKIIIKSCTIENEVKDFPKSVSIVQSSLELETKQVKDSNKLLIIENKAASGDTEKLKNELKLSVEFGEKSNCDLIKNSNAKYVFKSIQKSLKNNRNKISKQIPIIPFNFIPDSFPQKQKLENNKEIIYKMFEPIHITNNFNLNIMIPQRKQNIYNFCSNNKKIITINEKKLISKRQKEGKGNIHRNFSQRINLPELGKHKSPQMFSKKDLKRDFINIRIYKTNSDYQLDSIRKRKDKCEINNLEKNLNKLVKGYVSSLLC